MSVLVDLSDVDWKVMRGYKLALVKLAVVVEKRNKDESLKNIIVCLDDLTDFLDHLQTEAASVLGHDEVYGHLEDDNAQQNPETSCPDG